VAPKLSLEARMTVVELLRRGWSRVAIASTLSDGRYGAVSRAAPAGEGD
jgi:hypothetical protein